MSDIMKAIAGGKGAVLDKNNYVEFFLEIAFYRTKESSAVQIHRIFRFPSSVGALMKIRKNSLLG